MTPSFNIRSTISSTAQTHLLVEVGRQGISFTVREGNALFSNVVCYHFETGDDIADQLQQILAAEELLQQSFTKTDIVWLFADSVLVPHEYFNSSATKETLELVYGDAEQGEIKTDFLFRHNMHNIYRVPTAVESIVKAKFPYANQSHLYSLLPELAGKKDKQLFAIFYPRQLTAVLMINGNVQVMQTFSYANGRDAAYHLLNVCQQFDSSPDETQLHLSGMIDERSNLYSELYKYFLHLQFEPLPQSFEYADGIKEHPQHFFSHLFATAACV